ncbi:MAG: 30S ribosomal protein S9 [Chthoniobacterales bacterium]|nr:30S ribosomal protein S9 [Chthoniobacterales bacterium]
MDSTLAESTGRRKTAVACVKLYPGAGSIEINGRDFSEYFPSLSLQNQILKPLEATNNLHSFDIKAVAHGGGVSGQAGALRLAISRALVEYNQELRPVLKKEGLLTRDSRMKERKKSGQPGARKRFQFSKR